MTALFASHARLPMRRNSSWHCEVEQDDYRVRRLQAHAAQREASAATGRPVGRYPSSEPPGSSSGPKPVVVAPVLGESTPVVRTGDRHVRPSDFRQTAASCLTALGADSPFPARIEAFITSSQRVRQLGDSVHCGRS